MHNLRSDGGVPMRRAIIIALVLSALPALALAQTAQQAPPAPNTMSRQELRDEIVQLRAIIQGRAVRPQRPAGCVSPESRQFDFWVEQAVLQSLKAR